MARWTSSSHTISDIREWSRAGRLEVRPDFQRLAVWSAPAKIMLMDTILQYIPMPKIFLARTIDDGNTYRVVIDGQQRILAILDFLEDKFALEYPYNGKDNGKKFSELDKETQDSFLDYEIDFNEASRPTEKEIREVYSRVNKYIVALNKQELRRADYPGDFLEVSEKLAMDDYLDTARIFSPANRRRYLDVEYISELLAGMISGIQEKKITLDSFYIKYSKWNEIEKQEIVGRFHRTLEELQYIFQDTLNISRTRFRQKADFYTIFLVVDEFAQKNNKIKDKDLHYLRKDLTILQEYIAPESDIPICSEYAIKCVSQANSASSRKWRHQFIKSILGGTYKAEIGSEFRNILYRLKEELDAHNLYLSMWCSENSEEMVTRCEVCDGELTFDNLHNYLIGWNRSESVYQISNAYWIHSSCAKSDDWLILERPNDEQSNLF